MNSVWYEHYCYTIIIMVYITGDVSTLGSCTDSEFMEDGLLLKNNLIDIIDAALSMLNIDFNEAMTYMCNNGYRYIMYNGYYFVCRRYDKYITIESLTKWNEYIVKEATLIVMGIKNNGCNQITLIDKGKVTYLSDPNKFKKVYGEFDILFLVKYWHNGFNYHIEIPKNNLEKADSHIVKIKGTINLIDANIFKIFKNIVKDELPNDILKLIINYHI